jgi:hypothetical protein
VEREAFEQDEEEEEENMEIEAVSELEIIEPYVVTELTTTTTLVETADPPTDNDTTHLPDAGAEPEALHQKEIQLLLRRIQNHRRSWSTSAMAITNVDRYQTHVLAAALNTLRAWRAILRRHSLDAATVHAVATELFGLLQQSVQCGPLAGARPGYFQRCGGAVAGVVHAYLDAAVRDRDDAVQGLGWTARQAEAVEQWKARAQRAVEADTEPSAAMVQRSARAERVQSEKKARAKKAQE